MTISSTAPSTGTITIPPSVITAAAGKTIDFTSPTVQSALTTLCASLTTNPMVTTSSATNQLTSNLNTLFAGTYKGIWSGTPTSSGTWTVTIDSNGNVTGSTAGSSSTSISGSMLTQLTTGSKYKFVGTAGSSSWAGTLDVSTKVFSGTWTDSGSSGTFTTN